VIPPITVTEASCLRDRCFLLSQSSLLQNGDRCPGSVRGRPTPYQFAILTLCHTPLVRQVCYLVPLRVGPLSPLARCLAVCALSGSPRTLLISACLPVCASRPWPPYNSHACLQNPQCRLTIPQPFALSVNFAIVHSTPQRPRKPLIYPEGRHSLPRAPSPLFLVP